MKFALGEKEQQQKRCERGSAQFNVVGRLVCQVEVCLCSTVQSTNPISVRSIIFKCVMDSTHSDSRSSLS